MFPLFGHRTPAALATVVLAAIVAPAVAAASQVNIYSSRAEHLIRPQLEAFRNATGVDYNLITGKADALAGRIRAEGRNSPADVLLTVDAGRLVRAKDFGVLRPVRSDILETAIPARYRDPEGYWYGLGIRARTMFYAADRVDPSDLSTYEALTDPKWKGRILIRSSNNIYNQSLLASLVHHLGAAKAKNWARGIVANMARKPQGGDSDQLRAVAAGVGDIAVTNHYYYARLLVSKKARDRAVAAKLKPFWPNQSDRGVHVNISGAGVAKYAPNEANAVKLLEYLIGEEAQQIYAEVGHELPVRQGIALSETVAGLGKYKQDQIPLEILGRNNAAAVRIFDKVGWR